MTATTLSAAYIMTYDAARPSIPHIGELLATVSQVTVRQRVRRLLAPIPGAVPFARLVVETVRICFRYRVTGLSAEAAFFTLLSMPPLIMGLFAGVGFLGDLVDPNAIESLSQTIDRWARRFLTDDVVREVINPTVRDTLRGGRADLLSLGFAIALWSGSRALHVFLDAISIMYGQTGIRSIIGSRVMSLSLYLGSIVLSSVIFPLILIGPSYLADWLPSRLDFLVGLYWPVVGLLGLASLTALYHTATPDKAPFHYNLPGASLAVVIWLGVSTYLRSWAGMAVGGPSVFGPLSAPIVILLWFYGLALAILIGAGLNAAIRRLWPHRGYRGPVTRASDWWESRRSAEDRPRPLTPVDREES